MNRTVVVFAVLSPLVYCASSAPHQGHGASGPTSPCITRVSEVESGGCHEVVRLRGECSESDAVDAEHEWLSQRCPGWEPLSHALTSSVRGQPNKVEDHLRIRTAEGKELGFCFDITALWP